MPCFQCGQTGSPEGARFCVFCGYASLQACPYGCGQQMPVRADAPVAKCPTCERFTTVCCACGRLGSLEARFCQTTRCKLARRRPLEPLAAHGGVSGGAPLRLSRAWVSDVPTMIEPGGQTPATDSRFGGLASRYGALAWWQDARLLVFDVPHRGSRWPSSAPRVAVTFEPPAGHGLLPAQGGLLLAHGHAFLLGSSGVGRIVLGQSGRGETQHLSRRSLGNQLLTPDETSFGFEFDVPEASAPAPQNASDWAPHEVNWWAQTATPTLWLGLGDWNGTLVGARSRGADALFESENWPLPPSVTVSNWRELLVWNGAPVLRAQNSLWRGENDAWAEAFRVDGTTRSLEGAVPDGEWLWLWGRTSQGLWGRRLEARGASAEVSLPMEHDDRVFPFPCVRDSKITFFRSGRRNTIVTLDCARPLDDAWQQELPASTQIVWATSTVADDGHWLLYATDDGSIVSLWMLALAPVASTPVQLMNLKPLRDPAGSVGGTLAFALCDEVLVVNCASAKGCWIRAFDLSGEKSP